MSEIAIIDTYKKQGINLVPIPKGSGKSLNIQWAKYQREMYTDKIPNDQDFAVILGKISGNLIVIDFDQCDDLRELEKIASNILNKTLVVRTGDGYHAYFKVDELPKKANTFLSKGNYKMEVKSQGAYVVGASCNHYDKDEHNQYVLTGKKYNVISNVLTIAHLHTTGEQIIKQIVDLGWEGQTETDGNAEHIIIPTSELEKGNWSHGERYNNGFKLALRRFHMAWTYDDTINEANQINQKCNPPHNTTEVERWVTDAHSQFTKNQEDPQHTYFGKIKKTGSSKEEEENKIDKITEDVQELHRFKSYKDTEELLVHNGKIYKYAQATALIKEECEKRIEHCSTHNRNEVINKIIAQNFADRELFDADHNLLTLENCILNIKEMKFTSHSPKNLTTVLLPVDYNEKVSTKEDYTIKDIEEILDGTLFLKYLKSCFTLGQEFDHEQFYTILEIMACTLLKKPLDKAFMFVGAGANGKSVLLEYIERMLGSDNVSNIPIHDIEMERFAKAELNGKLANIFADIESHELKKTSNLKMIVSGESINAEKKNQQPFKFKPFAKMIFSANKFPIVKDQSDGFFRRFIIIHWKKQFLGAEQNPRLREQLSENVEERSLVFNLLVRMARNLDKRGTFKFMKRINEVRTDWNRHSDPVMLFIEKLVHEKEGKFEKKSSVFKKYKNFCILNEIHPLTINQFGRVFGEYYETEQIKESDGINRKVWVDIEVRELQKQEKLEEYE